MDSREYKLIGRNDILQSFHDAWTNRCRMFGFYGMTKVGKTRLCAEFVKLLKDSDNSKIHEIEFNFKEINDYEDFEEILFERFDITCKRSTVGREKILTYMRKNKDTKFILVFDSLEEIMPKATKDGSNPEKFAETTWDLLYKNIVKKFLQGCENVYFCLTSCTWAKFAEFAKKSHLQAILPLLKQDSIELLKEVVTGNMEDDSDLETIAELCDGLPGSIVNVGTDIMLHKGDLSGEDMISILIGRKLQALSGEFLPASEKIEDSMNEQIRKLPTEKRNNLKVFAAGGPGMSVAAGTQAFDYDKEALFKFDVLIPLKYRSLVNADRKSNDISVHPITQEFMKIHHASTTTQDKAIAKKVQNLIKQYCEKVDTEKEKPPEYVEELKDYCHQGFPEVFIPVKQKEEQTVKTRAEMGHRLNIVRTSQDNSRLNDLSPAISTEKDDSGKFIFPNITAFEEQKPSLNKDIVYKAKGDTRRKISDSNISRVSIEKKDSSKQTKNLNEFKMNLGCSIEENDRITIPPERRLSEIVKRNNLSRSLSAQENFSESKSNNLSRAMTVQENPSKLQQKRSNFNRADAIEDSGEVKWDDCSGSSQNITSTEGSSQSCRLSDESNNSSMERNDTVSFDDNLNIPASNHLEKENNTEPSSFNMCSISEDDRFQLDSDNLPIVRPKIVYRADDNSLKRLLFSQTSQTSGSLNGDTYMKNPVEHSCSFGPSLDPNSLLDSLKSETSPKTLDCQSLDFNSLCDSHDKHSNSKLQSSNFRQTFNVPNISLLALVTKSESQGNTNNNNGSQGTTSLVSNIPANRSQRVPNRAEKMKLLLDNSLNT